MNVYIYLFGSVLSYISDKTISVVKKHFSVSTMLKRCLWQGHDCLHDLCSGALSVGLTPQVMSHST